MMRVMRPVIKCNLNLIDLKQSLGGKYYAGRPHMLVIQMNNGRNIQIFKGGCIQILGRVSDEDAESMRCELLQRLNKNVDDDSACFQLENILQENKFEIANIVLHIKLPNNVSLRNIKYTDSSLFYEVEIFPAALIRKWSPAHLAVFSNGNVILTGIRSLHECEQLLAILCQYLP